MKRYEIFCGNLSWNGFMGWTTGIGQAFWTMESAQEACDSLQERYLDAVLHIEEVPYHDGI